MAKLNELLEFSSYSPDSAPSDFLILFQLTVDCRAFQAKRFSIVKIFLKIITRLEYMYSKNVGPSVLKF